MLQPCTLPLARLHRIGRALDGGVAVDDGAAGGLHAAAALRHDLAAQVFLRAAVGQRYAGSGAATHDAAVDDRAAAFQPDAVFQAVDGATVVDRAGRAGYHDACIAVTPYRAACIVDHVAAAVQQNADQPPRDRTRIGDAAAIVHDADAVPAAGANHRAGQVRHRAAALQQHAGGAAVDGAALVSHYSRHAADTDAIASAVAFDQAGIDHRAARVGGAEQDPRSLGATGADRAAITEHIGPGGTAVGDRIGIRNEGAADKCHVRGGRVSGDGIGAERRRLPQVDLCDAIA